MVRIVKSLFIALLLSQLMVNAYSKSRHLTLEEIVTLQSVKAASVSPNGQWTALLLNVPRKPYIDKDGAAYSELHLVNAKGEQRPYITGEVNISNVTWNDDNQFIFYTAKRFGEKHHSIYRLPVNGGESVKFLSHDTSIKQFSLSYDGQTLYFIAPKAPKKQVKTLKKKGFKAEIYEEDIAQNYLYQVDLSDDKKTPKLLLSEEHIHSVSSHPSRSNLLVRMAPTSLVDDNYMRSQYQIINNDGVAITRFATKGKLGAAQWSPDGKYVAMITAKDENDPAAGRLILARAKNGKLTSLLPDYLGHVKSLSWLSSNELAFVGHKGTGSEIGIVDINTKKTRFLPNDGEGVIRSIASSKNSEKWVALKSSQYHPVELYQFLNQNDGQLKRLTHSNPLLSSVDFPQQQSITYNARDGLSLQGILILPNGYTLNKRKKRLPLVMMIHGGPESHMSNHWLDRYSDPAKYFASKGFAVFFPNYRGSTGRGVEFSQLGQNDYAGKEFDDIVDAIEHLSNEGIIDKKRVGITGSSYGGYASAWGATALSEHFAASVMFVGISNQLSKYGTTDIPIEMYNVHARQYPWDKWQWMLERSPIYHTDKAKTPLLILHGKNDSRVHPSQSMELYRYMKTRTKTPVRLVYYPGEGHGNKKVAAQLDYSMRLVRWMSYYLKGDKNKQSMPDFDLLHESRLKKTDDKE